MNCKNFKPNMFFVIITTFATFVLILRYWSRWNIFMQEYNSLLPFGVMLYLLPLLLVFSYITALFSYKKLALFSCFITFFSIEYILYIRKYIYVDLCDCKQLFPFLSTSTHFWINTGILLIILICMFPSIHRYLHNRGRKRNN